MDWKFVGLALTIGIIFTVVAWFLTGSELALIIGMLIIYLELRYAKPSKRR